MMGKWLLRPSTVSVLGKMATEEHGNTWSAALIGALERAKRCLSWE